VAAPKQAVSALPASPPRISLLTSAITISERERWESGFSYEPEACGEGNTATWDPCTNPDLDNGVQSGAVDVETFAIAAVDSCSSFGSAARTWKDRAQRKLAACESNLIEAELWSGAIARSSGWANKYLTHLDSDVLSDLPIEDAVQALACLEQALATCNCGSRGMIHATPQTVILWAQGGGLRREGNLILTINDTVVVPGSGYDGSGPQQAVDGAPVPAADGSVWAYATGMVHIRMSPIEIIPNTPDEAMDRSANRLTYWAQRTVAATFDCCLFAIEMDLRDCGIGGAGS